MAWLVLGLVLFLGAHSVRIVAEGWRAHMLRRMGELPWKGLMALLSVAGFALIVWGYGQARLHTVALWTPPRGMAHAAAALMVVSFILLVAAYVPGNAIKARMRHPMVLSVKVWAFAHLLANGNLADVVLFGSFLVWAVLDFRAARGRDRAQGLRAPAGRFLPTLITIVAGLAAYAGFAFWAHARWIGVSPFGALGAAAGA